MKKTLPALTLILALLATACAAPAAKRSPDETLLLDCRAKADEAVKSRYTAPWEHAVQRCMDEARTK